MSSITSTRYDGTRSVLRRWRQENQDFIQLHSELETSLGSIRPSFKRKGESGELQHMAMASSHRRDSLQTHDPQLDMGRQTDLSLEMPLGLIQV